MQRFLMEQPGLRLEERVGLAQEGLGHDQIREFDAFLGEYETFVTEERGPEARWALGLWLMQAQHGAGRQDAAENIIADRCQGRSRGAHVFPLRREPADPALRARLVRWTNSLCGLMADIFERGMLENAPGVPEVPRGRGADGEDAGDEGRAQRNPSRSRSHGRRARVDGRGEVDSDVSLMDMGGKVSEEAEEEADAEGVDAEGDVEDGGDRDAGAVPAVAVPVAPDSTALPGAGIGPMGLEALDTADEHAAVAQTEGDEHARRSFELEASVRNTLHRVSTGTGREIVRRLLDRQEKMANIMYWLQRALSQALRTCPNLEHNVDHGEATREVQRFWARILGENADEPSFHLLAACIHSELERREGVATMERSRSPLRREPESEPGRHGGDAVGTRPRPSKAPWLREVSGSEPPCLRPWWDRTLTDHSAAASSSSGGVTVPGPMQMDGVTTVVRSGRGQ